MPVKIFKIPGEGTIFPSVNKKLLVTGAAIQAIKGGAYSILLGGVEAEEAIGKSDFGTPVMDRLELAPLNDDGTQRSYIDLEGNQIFFGPISIPTVILEVNQSKNIVKESIQGRNGTVKEYVSDGDYIINGRGVISNKDNIIPLDNLRVFKEIMQVPQQIEVVSQYLNEIFEINQMVIESFSMPQIEGVRNELPFTFQALSDVALDLEELE